LGKTVHELLGKTVHELLETNNRKIKRSYLCTTLTKNVMLKIYLTTKVSKEKIVECNSGAELCQAVLLPLAQRMSTVLD